MGATILRVAPFLAPRHTGQEPQRPFDLARPAGFEPATRCLEGSCSVRLSYGRPNVIVHGQDHMKATRRSQCVGLWRRRSAPALANSQPYLNPASTTKTPPHPSLRPADPHQPRALRPHDPGPAQLPRAVAPRTQPHGPSGPESPQREKNAHEAAAALGPRGSEYRAEPGSAEPPDQ